jgi:hypothetical protein
VAVAAVAVFFTATVGGIDGLVDRQNDIGNCYFRCLFGQGVTTARAPSGLNQLVTAEFAKQLL